MKRAFDVGLSACGLLLLSPVLFVALLLVWLQDRRSPLYIAPRVGLHGRMFHMYKIRSMVVGADRTGVESTGAADIRITRIGAFVRRWKLDEIPQLWNVLRGQMSLVGPRPNTAGEVENYTPDQRSLLAVRPGITDIASIVFADEGEILRHASDPDEAYREIIWPWKSRLGQFYVSRRSVALDFLLIALTAFAAIDRQRVLQILAAQLRKMGAPEDLVRAAAREAPLVSGSVGSRSPHGGGGKS